MKDYKLLLAGQIKDPKLKTEINKKLCQAVEAAGYSSNADTNDGRPKGWITGKGRIIALDWDVLRKSRVVNADPETLAIIQKVNSTG